VLCAFLSLRYHAAFAAFLPITPPRFRRYVADVTKMLPLAPLATLFAAAVIVDYAAVIDKE